MNEYFDSISNKLELGNFLSYEEINGGLTNRMYKIETSKGFYGIKILNQEKDLKVVEKSEEIASLAFKNGVFSLPAIKFNNKFIQNIDGKNILIYNWCNGKILLTKELNLAHVRKMANQLAKLHAINVGVYNNIIIKKNINFTQYLSILTDNINVKKEISILEEIDIKVHECYNKLSRQVSYVHGDYNRKNILWKKNKLTIIDFETATISNPSLDLFNAAWFLTDDVNEDKYHAFINEYFKLMTLEDNIETSIYAALIYELEWLEFSIKRTILSNAEERQVGFNSINSSLNEIINYYKKIPLMIKIVKQETRKK